MAAGLLRLRSRFLLQTTTITSTLLRPNPPLLSSIKSQPSIFSPFSDFNKPSALHFFSTAARRHPTRPKPIDIGARARQLQARRLWTYAVTFSCIAGFIVIVLNNFQDQLVFYVTPTDAMEKYKQNPQKNKFRLGGLVLEGSVAQPASSPEMEFVITDLVTDILVRYNGSLPDLFREGHSVVVEGFVAPFTAELRREVEVGGKKKGVAEKARSGECYFKATEVLAKHDEKYMPAEVAAAIEKNKKRIEAGEGREEHGESN